MTPALPLLIEHGVICQRLHNTPTTLRRWETKGVIPRHTVGPARRYLEWEVEKALQENHRFGPDLAPGIGIAVLRERVAPEVICEWLQLDRKTLERRMDDGIIPFYKIGQTYRFAPDEILFTLGITAAALAHALPPPASTTTPVSASVPAISPGGFP